MNPGQVNVGALERAVDDAAAVAAYGTLQAAQLKQFREALPYFLDAWSWPREHLVRERRVRLRGILAVAKARSPWHAKRLAHVNVETFVEDDLPSLPTMTKTDLMANFDEIVTDPKIRLSHVEKHLAGMTTDAYLLGANHAVTSSGSTGTKGIFVFGWEDWIEFGLSSARPIAQMLKSAPLGTNEHAVAFLGTGALHGSSAFAQSFAPWIVSQFQKFTPLPIDMPIDGLVEVLNRLQPTCLSGYPSFINELACAAVDGKLRIRPLAILVGGETLYREQHIAIEKAFGATLFNFYGCSEASCLASSCPDGNGLHMCEDTAILEPLDRSGHPVPPAVRADKLLVTNLSNTLLPLIRYELDDAITLADSSEVCSCGSSFQKIEAIDGRADDTFTYGSVFVHPFALSSSMDADPNVVQYQVHQTPRGVHVLARTRGTCDLRAMGAFIEDALRARGLAEPRVTIARVNKIERGPVGKLRRFVPLRSVESDRRLQQT